MLAYGPRHAVHRTEYIVYLVALRSIEFECGQERTRAYGKCARAYGKYAHVCPRSPVARSAGGICVRPPPALLCRYAVS